LLARLDLVNIEVNTCATYRSRWTGKLIHDTLTEGWWSSGLFSYIIDEDNIDNTPNAYTIEIEAETLNGFNIKQTASLWTRVIDAYLHQKIGLDDVNKRVLEDWEDTLKVFVASKTDRELKNLQNKEVGIGQNQVFDENDTLFSKTLPEAGLASKNGDIWISIGTIELPDSVKKANEAKAIYEVFGENGPYVSSTKSLTGHECWMAGASEVIYSTIMMQNDIIAPNLNFKNPDEDAKKINITGKTIDKKFDIYLSNSFGFGGTNSALVLKKMS
jgi:hypothetical protein